jgi:hypothetical protein
MERLRIKETLGETDYIYSIYIDGVFTYISTIKIDTDLTKEQRVKRILGRLLKNKLLF